jgi:hypothetical protein
MIGCIGEPISWPRLEEHARTPGDAAITAHVAECEACRACLHEIEADVVALPPLPAAPEKRRARWWFGVWPALAAAAAVAILLFVLRPRDQVVEGVATIKGVGEVVIDVVRERDGVVRDDVRTFAPGDRWKVVVTCAPQAHVDITVEVRDGSHVDHPLQPAALACGNRIVLPGAFTLDGTRTNEVCARIGEDVACLTLRPE